MPEYLSAVDSVDGGMQALSVTPSITVSTEFNYNETTKYSKECPYRSTIGSNIPISTAENSIEEYLEETPGILITSLA